MLSSASTLFRRIFGLEESTSPLEQNTPKKQTSSTKKKAKQQKQPKKEKETTVVEDDSDVPEAFLCPITQEIMVSYLFRLLHRSHLELTLSPFAFLFSFVSAV